MQTEKKNKRKHRGGDKEFRNWCFTLNNYTQLDIESVENLECKGVDYGKEEGKEGTPHLQGYVCYKSGKTLKQVRALLPAHPHWEPMKGSLAQNEKYCSKEGELKVIGKMAGRPGAQVGLIKLKAPPPEPPRLPWENTEQKVFTHWYYGDTGTGKDYRVTAVCATQKFTVYEHEAAQGNWFDNYRGQQAIHFKDFKGNHMSYGMFKQLCDPYRGKYHMQQKGVNGGVEVIATQIFFTSDTHPIETWKVLRTEKNKWDQVERRLTTMMHCYEHIEGPECLEKGHTNTKGMAVPEPIVKPWGKPVADQRGTELTSEEKYQAFLAS